MSIARLGHVELLCTDFEDEVTHFKNMLGLEETHREDGRVYLKAYQEWVNYSLILTDADRSGAGHIALQVEEPGDLEMYADRIEESGYEVEWREAGAEPGLGEAIRFETPAEQEFELFHEIENVDVPPEKRSRLKNQPQKRPKHGIGPTRIDHATMFVQDVEECYEWFSEVLDFKLREYLVDDDGDMTGAWVSVSPLVHEHAFVDADEAMFNHVSYYLKTNSEIYRAVDLLKEYDVKITCGPAQHGISQANCLYYRTPSMNQVELFAGGYLIFDPNWEPIEWTIEDLPEAVYWWGRERDWSPQESDAYSKQEYEAEQ